MLAQLNVNAAITGKEGNPQRPATTGKRFDASDRRVTDAEFEEVRD